MLNVAQIKDAVELLDKKVEIKQKGRYYKDDIRRSLALLNYSKDTITSSSSVMARELNKEKSAFGIIEESKSDAVYIRNRQTGIYTTAQILDDGIVFRQLRTAPLVNVIKMQDLSFLCKGYYEIATIIAVDSGSQEVFHRDINISPMFGQHNVYASSGSIDETARKLAGYNIEIKEIEIKDSRDIKSKIDERVSKSKLGAAQRKITRKLSREFLDSQSKVLIEKYCENPDTIMKIANLPGVRTINRMLTRKMISHRGKQYIEKNIERKRQMAIDAFVAKKSLDIIHSGLKYSGPESLRYFVMNGYI